jgi:hypothetical protein
LKLSLEIGGEAGDDEEERRKKSRLINKDETIFELVRAKRGWESECLVKEVQGQLSSTVTADNQLTLVTADGNHKRAFNTTPLLYEDVLCCTTLLIVRER